MSRGAGAPVVLLIALLIAVPAILPVLAYASQPDPAWIRGIYDDADADDVVVLVMSATGDRPAPAPAVAHPLHASVERLPQLGEQILCPLALSGSEPRAPPRS